MMLGTLALVIAVDIPLWIVASQWVLLFALAWLVLIMYRQMALVLHLRDTNTEREGLAVGATAPSFEYLPFNQREGSPARFEVNGGWSLLLIADPGCSSCRQALLAAERLAPKLGPDLHILVVTTAGRSLIEAVDEFREATVEIAQVGDDVPTQMYRTTVTPFAFLIDPEGIIRGKGAATDEAALRKLVRVADRRELPVVPSASSVL
jgi:hypothetical protein